MRKQKILLFIASLLPIIWMSYALLTDQLGANPVEAITRDTGLWALRFLCLTLVITPLNGILE